MRRAQLLLFQAIDDCSLYLFKLCKTGNWARLKKEKYDHYYSVAYYFKHSMHLGEEKFVLNKYCVFTSLLQEVKIFYKYAKEINMYFYCDP